jgi:hypothetical protein
VSTSCDYVRKFHTYSIEHKKPWMCNIIKRLAIYHTQKRINWTMFLFQPFLSIAKFTQFPPRVIPCGWFHIHNIYSLQLLYNLRRSTNRFQTVFNTWYLVDYVVTSCLVIPTPEVLGGVNVGYLQKISQHLELENKIKLIIFIIIIYLKFVFIKCNLCSKLN